MWGIVYIVIACVMYIHLGLGDTLSNIFHSNLYIFKCVKCITWQCVLIYSLFFLHYEVVLSLAISFATAYIALWLDLLLAKLAKVYEKEYEKLE